VAWHGKIWRSDHEIRPLSAEDGGILESVLALHSGRQDRVAERECGLLLSGFCGKCVIAYRRVRDVAARH